MCRFQIHFLLPATHASHDGSALYVDARLGNGWVRGVPGIHCHPYVDRAISGGDDGRAEGETGIGVYRDCVSNAKHSSKINLLNARHITWVPLANVCPAIYLTTNTHTLSSRLPTSTLHTQTYNQGLVKIVNCVYFDYQIEPQ